MATWNSIDLANLNRAIAEGAQSVAFSDGKRVVYRSLADMMALRDQMERELNPARGSALRKVAAHSRGFSGGHSGSLDFHR